MCVFERSLRRVCDLRVEVRKKDEQKNGEEEHIGERDD